MFQDNQPQQESHPEQPVQQQPNVQAQRPVVPPPTPENTTQEERTWAAIGYIAFLGVVSLAIKPKSAFCNHHATRGLVIFIFWFVSLILFAMPSFIGVIGGLLLLGLTGLAIFGIVKSIQSYKLELPILSSLANKVPVSAIIGSVTGKTPEVTKPSQENAEQVVPTTEQAPPAPKQPEVKPTPVEQPEIVQPKTVQSDEIGEKQDPPSASPQV